MFYKIVLDYILSSQQSFIKQCEQNMGCIPPRIKPSQRAVWMQGLEGKYVERKVRRMGTPWNMYPLLRVFSHRATMLQSSRIQLSLMPAAPPKCLVLKRLLLQEFKKDTYEWFLNTWKTLKGQRKIIKNTRIIILICLLFKFTFTSLFYFTNY